jgi:hypothetical protein
MQSEREQKKGLNRFFYDLKNTKKNWDIVKSSPYATLKLRYYTQAVLVFLLIIFMGYQIINLIIKFNGGSSYMTIIGRALMLLILVIIISRTWGTLKPLKTAMKQYDNNPQHINYKKLNVKAEVDDILQHFENKKSKGGESNANAISKKEKSGTTTTS